MNHPKTKSPYIHVLQNGVVSGVAHSPQSTDFCWWQVCFWWGLTVGTLKTQRFSRSAGLFQPTTRLAFCILVKERSPPHPCPCRREAPGSRSRSRSPVSRTGPLAIGAGPFSDPRLDIPGKKVEEERTPAQQPFSLSWEATYYPRCPQIHTWAILYPPRLKFFPISSSISHFCLSFPILGDLFFFLSLFFWIPCVPKSIEEWTNKNPFGPRRLQSSQSVRSIIIMDGHWLVCDQTIYPGGGHIHMYLMADFILLFCNHSFHIIKSMMDKTICFTKIIRSTVHDLWDIFVCEAWFMGYFLKKNDL